MEIRIINPNTTASMTEKIGRAAQEVAATGTVITAVNPADGPARGGLSAGPEAPPGPTGANESPPGDASAAFAATSGSP